MVRIILTGVVAAALSFSQAPQPGQGPPGAGTSLTGRVVTGTGPEARPVRRARVTLLARGGTGPRITDTDTKGAYRFDRVPAGDYKVTVEKPGFVKLDADAAPHATLTMERGGAIEGVVTDAAGDPVLNVVVAALQPQPDGAKPKLVAQTRTDDLGRYRLHSLAAGDYVVEAATDQTFLRNAFLMPGEKRPDINRSYYPAGATTLDESKPVHVSAARDASAVDLIFTPAPPVKDPAAPPRPPHPDATGTARIAGRVIDATSGRPIKNAELLLLPTQGQRITNWTRSDSQGRFEYTSLPVKAYTLKVNAKRYVSLDFGQKRPGESGTPIQITTEGQDFKADVALPRGSAVEGTLLDEFGDPAPSVLVQLAQKRYVAGRQRLISGAGPLQTAPSDDKGHYRIMGVPPGEYYIAALSGVYTDQNEVGGFAPTFAPGTADAGAAVPVIVAFGADTTVSFALAPATTVTVSGTMVDAEGKLVGGRGTILLATSDRMPRMDINIARAVTAPDGTFVLRNVPTGIYTLQGFGVPPPGYQGPFNLGAMPFGAAPLAVGDTDLDGVVLKVTSGTVLRGRITFDDEGAARPKPDQVHVIALPVEFESAPIAGGPPPSETHDDWTFEVTHMSGIRRISVGVGSTSWALRKVTLSGIDVTDTAVDLRTKNVDDVEVLLTSKVSKVAGGASNDTGPLLDYAVVIFSSDPTKWIDRSRFVVLGRPNQFGRFEVRGLPAEEYLAVALPNVVEPEWTAPEFLQQIRPLATSFALQEGESKTLELKLKKRPQ
jgi:protocatechuate 3,4-dioxygenase beta subunit